MAIYKHVVMWKFKDGADGKSSAELAKTVKEKWEWAATFIPEIESVELATNVGNYGASFYHLSMIATFKNEDCFWAYTKYPQHDEVLEYVQKVQESEIIVDYWI